MQLHKVKANIIAKKYTKIYNINSINYGLVFAS